MQFMPVMAALLKVQIYNLFGNVTPGTKKNLKYSDDLLTYVDKINIELIQKYERK